MTNRKRYCNIKSLTGKRHTKVSGNGGKVQWEDEILIMIGNDLNVSEKMTEFEGKEGVRRKSGSADPFLSMNRG